MSGTCARRVARAIADLSGCGIGRVDLERAFREIKGVCSEGLPVTADSICLPNATTRVLIKLATCLRSSYDIRAVRPRRLPDSALDPRMEIRMWLDGIDGEEEMRMAELIARHVL